MADDTRLSDVPAVPLDVMLRIFDKVYATDALARCRAVRKDWRDMLDAREDATTRPDLSPAVGVIAVNAAKARDAGAVKAVQGALIAHAGNAELAESAELLLAAL